MTPSGGPATPVAANQQVVITGSESPRVETAAPPTLTAWDRWNYQRSDYLAQPASAKQLPAGVYGAETLDQHGTWRTVESYGSVWVPAGVAPGWSPYSTGRWIWDPRFGWTWLDDAPWGWAPYHHGRWVFVGSLLGVGAGADHRAARLLARAGGLPGRAGRGGAATATGRRSAGASP